MNQILSVLAKDNRVTYFAYGAGFFALGVLKLVDFISEKRQSCRKTRRAGYFVLSSLFAAISVVIFYAYLQWIVDDTKEMMTALLAGLFGIHSLAQTVWGLAQLSQFKEHSEDASNCVRACHTGSEEKIDELEVDSNMLVSEVEIDNRFTRPDLPILLNRRFGWKLNESTLRSYAVRWTSSYLYSLGHMWGGCSMSVRTLCSLRSPVISALMYTTHFVPDIHSTAQLLAVRQMYYKWRTKGITGPFGKALQFIPSFSDTLDLAFTD